ncbi:OmpA family protein [Plastoroseomonas arctica]|uniref:OmpA family protein n=1 Tax=Plastoroseomonas arctica TaxID=1509237 RepID=A0AAF1KRL8_9PROT|nr:OmpA family protein [Plastoroseomonas arctica]MBR0654507.1 OmpA family protein [Plastoroseomonas arctica]
MERLIALAFIILVAVGTRGNATTPLTRICFFSEQSDEISAECTYQIRQVFEAWQSVNGYLMQADAALRAEMLRRSGTLLVFVSGHSDRRENSQPLGLRRARAVVRSLLAAGIPADRFIVYGFGGTRPLVPTAANVSEPQNRNVMMAISESRQPSTQVNDYDRDQSTGHRKVE